MNAVRFSAITSRYPQLKIAVVGDFCLDRYLEIDPARTEISLETGLEVYNVVRVRGQPGGAGTILNNLVAMGIGQLFAVGFCGEDGEGWELRRALATLPGVNLGGFLTTPLRRTFVYCKPLLVEADRPPRELNRLDFKNWSPTPRELQEELAARVGQLAASVDALVLLDQVDAPDTGVVTRLVARAAHSAVSRRPELVTLADSRRGVHDWPALGFKMNVDELARSFKTQSVDLKDVKNLAAELARANGQPTFVTLANHGIVGAAPGRPAEHVPAHPVRSAIDVVGAGDAVTANLAAALAAGATVCEAMQLAMAAASVVVHQLGTTGTASVEQVANLLESVRLQCCG
jgi:rfaE bifunctional protein kinase chain/domain